MPGEVLVQPKRVRLTCLFDVVTIELHCGDEYEARVLIDDLVARLDRGEKITVAAARKEGAA